MHVAALTLWRDPGYTENSITQPKLGSSALPAPDAIFTDLHPSRDRLFSEIKVKGDYLTLYNMSYLRLNYTITDTENQYFFGWVETVECISDNENFQECLIRFHLDLWRTFKDRAIFKEGIVERRPLSGAHPIQNCPYRYMVKDSNEEMCRRQVVVPSPLWLYFSFIREGSDSQRTYLSFGCIPFLKPVDTDRYEMRIKSEDPQEITGHVTVDTESVLSGEWVDLLKMDPQRIKYAFISPIPPNNPVTDIQAGATKTLLVVDMTDWSAYHFNDSNRYLFYDDGGDNTYEFSSTLSKTYTTDEKNKVIIQGFDCETVFTLPYGFSVRDYTYRMILSSTVGYIQIRFDGKDSHSEGLCATIPCPAIDVTENSWSSYVYSGQRDFDRRYMELQARASAIESVASSLGLGASLGGAKGLIAAEGAAVKGLGAAATVGAVGAGVGALTMGAVQAMGAGINYGFKEKIVNPEMQGLKDQLHARQAEGLVASGIGFDWIFKGYENPHIAVIKVDDYSAAIFDNDIEIYGVHCQEATADCQSLIEAGGPLLITGLDVGGEIPPAAKQAMSDMFAKGVRLV